MSTRKRAILVSAAIVLSISAVPFGCVTDAALHLGNRVEHFEQYESAHLCDGRLYVSYRASMTPFHAGLQLERLLGASDKRHQPRFAEVPLAALEWRTLTRHSSSQPEATPEFGEGAIPTDPALCERALQIKTGGPGLLSVAVLEALASDDLVLFKAYKALAIARRLPSGGEWAFVSVPHAIHPNLVGIPGARGRVRARGICRCPHIPYPDPLHRRTALN